MAALIVVFLPWGAFTAKFPTPINTDGQISQVSIGPDRTEAEIKVAKHCKGPAVLGSPRGPQLFESVPQPDFRLGPQVSAPWFVTMQVRLKSTFDGPELDPPIAG